MAWQGKMKGEKTKAEEFVKQAVGMQGFQAFAFMKGKLPYIHVGCNVGVFFEIRNMSLDQQGKVVMFVGDRTTTRDPMPVT